ncbi:carboxypeptidase regulatory-like domain-containing protein [Calditrichota bacterium]
MKTILKFRFIVLLVIILFSAVSCSLAQIEFTGHTIATNFNGAHRAFPIDLDGDDDMDVTGAAYGSDLVAWWENDGNQDFQMHNIHQGLNGANNVHAADVDSDGDIDILASAGFADAMMWYENDGDEDFTSHTISNTFNYARSIYAVDVDSDDDIDVIGVADLGDDLSWWENDGEEDFEEHLVDENLDYPIWCYAEDVDSDGDMDLLSAAAAADDITWWENDGDEDFTEHIVDGDYDGAHYVHADDVDGDGDIDILGASGAASLLTWWENDGDENFTEHLVTDEVTGPSYIGTFDMDMDGDMDILGSSGEEDCIYWWENDGDQEFTAHVVTDNVDRAYSVYAADMDGDLDFDIVCAGFNANNITWWESDLDPDLDASIDGFITDAETGDGIEDAIIRVGPGRDTTDVNGYYFIAETVSGDRDAIIFHPDYTQLREEIEIQVGENTHDFELIPLSPVSGTVIDEETNNPVANASITFGIEETTTDENGEWEILPQEQGEFIVHIIAEHYFDFTDTVEVEQGENTFDFEIVILSADLTGFVSDEMTGEMIFGALVTVTESDSVEPYREVETDENGEYTAPGLHDGVRYLVSVSHEGYAPSDTEVVLIRWNDENTQDFELTPIYERTIAQLQTEQDLETWVFTTGIVTQGTNTTNTEHTNIYIQDNSGWGIQIYADAPTEPENNIIRGDSVNVIGFLVEEDDITRITNFELEVISNDNPIPEPLVESTGDMSGLGEREGTWAQITGQINRDPPDQGDYSLIVDDGSGQCEVRIIETTAIDLTDMVEEDWGIFTGVIGMSRQGMRIIPNIQEDVTRIAIDPPVNLAAESEEIQGDTLRLEITLTWEHDHLDDWIRFKIYRDDEHIGNTQELNWSETMVDPNPGEYESYTWIYTVTAFYDVGESDHSNEAEVIWDISSVIEHPYSGIPTEWALEAVYPNPFNPELSIIVALPQTSELNVRVYNILGKEVAMLANGSFVPGYHKFVLNAQNLTSGVYLIQAIVPSQMKETKKVVLMK